MPVRSAEAQWEGPLKEGKGRIKLESGAFEGPYSFTGRFEQGTGTNPEELLGGAHAGCFNMALAKGLAEAGYTPEKLQTTASVRMEKGDQGFAISRIDLNVRADVPGLEEDEFQRLAQAAKAGCVISRALGGVSIDLKAELTATVM
jgi:osmotically inducible protein OsmC